MSDLSVLDIGTYDPYNDLIVIEGIRYSGQLLRDGLGVNGLQAGKCLRIVKRNEGIVTMQTLTDVDELLGLLEHAVNEADGWHDECRGGPIEDDARIARAKQVLGIFKPTGESNG